MSRTVPNPKSKAFINQRFSSKLNEVLESLSETSFGPKQMVDFANNIWIVNDSSFRVVPRSVPNKW
jgi:hypothetical protein